MNSTLRTNPVCLYSVGWFYLRMDALLMEVTCEESMTNLDVIHTGQDFLLHIYLHLQSLASLEGGASVDSCRTLLAHTDLGETFRPGGFLCILSMTDKGHWSNILVKHLRMNLRVGLPP